MSRSMPWGMADTRRSWLANFGLHSCNAIPSTHPSPQPSPRRGEGVVAVARVGRCASEPVTGPLWSGEGWTIRPRRGRRQGCLRLFDTTGTSCRKARPTLTDSEGEARRARNRGAFSFGYFSLGKQRKVTRPPAGGRKLAAGEPGCNNANIEALHYWMIRFAHPSGAALRAFFALRAHPAYAGMTSRKGCREHPPLTPPLSPKGRGSKTERCSP
ncbi:hypothetical protein SAMN05216570_3451 [Dyella sp. OK004]|nr:hypothetical protein SAMN05216570_3451 [Dyella sp. OK004]